MLKIYISRCLEIFSIGIILKQFSISKIDQKKFAFKTAELKYKKGICFRNIYILKKLIYSCTYLYIYIYTPFLFDVLFKILHAETALI